MKTYEEMAQSAAARIAAHEAMQKKRKKMAARIAAPVLCLCLVAAAGYGLTRGGKPQPAQGIDPGGRTEAAVQVQAEAQTQPAREEAAALYTDPIVLPEPMDGVELDMIGCLVYQGKVYTQHYGQTDAAAVEPLLGERIGQASGSLDEWSSQAAWATELASTYSGDVYTVKGYDAGFRLCVCDREAGWAELLDNYDGIGLTTGADLFEDRLHIRGNIENITYLRHDSWNNDEPTAYRYEAPDVTDAQWEEFFDQLCASAFERIDYERSPDFYSAPVQGHLYLQMRDGTQVQLRLLGGGYVGNQDLGWFFVKMPGAAFDTVLAACQ